MLAVVMAHRLHSLIGLWLLLSLHILNSTFWYNGNLTIGRKLSGYIQFRSSCKRLASYVCSMFCNRVLPLSSKRQLGATPVPHTVFGVTWMTLTNIQSRGFTCLLLVLLDSLWLLWGVMSAQVVDIICVCVCVSMCVCVCTCRLYNNKKCVSLRP